MELHVTSVDFGAYIGANARPLIHLPTEFGAITIVDAYVAGSGAGTAIGLKLVGMSSAGTPAVNGTVGAFAGTVVYAEGVPAALTISSGVVDPDTSPWIGVVQTSGTAPANAVLSIAYLMGK